MTKPLLTLRAFTTDEYKMAHVLLAAKVAQMMGRTFEEADWTDVYCAAKGIPRQDWSNLRLDVMYNGVGVEQKKLGRNSKKPISSWCGESLMHPAETRAIRVPPSNIEPNEAMRIVFEQYRGNLEQKRLLVKEQCTGDAEPDMRTGLLLYQPGALREFLYFEWLTTAPDAKEYYAIWRENPPKGTRRGSTNLWIYDRETRQKRFSVTTEAGNKLQPYYDIPAPDDPNLHIFTVQGESMGDGRIRVWITTQTARELRQFIGSLDYDTLSKAILNANPEQAGARVATLADAVEEVIISADAYDALILRFKGVSDEHRMQLFLEHCLELS